LEVHIIANPTAGRGGAGKRLALLEELLQRMDIPYCLECTSYPGEATDLARRAVETGKSIIAAAGGDGTVAEVLNGLAGSDGTLAIIPMGTGNDLARGLGIPLELAGAVALLKEGQGARMDLLREASRFLGGAGAVGIACQVIENVERNRDSFIKGPPAFLIAALKTILEHRPYAVKIEMDGLTLEEEVVGVFVLNSPYIAGGMHLAPTAHLADGLFEVVLVERMNRPEILLNLPKVYWGGHLGHPAVKVYQTRWVRITLPTPTMKILDGELVPSTPLEARLLPGALSVLVTEERAAALARGRGNQTPTETPLTINGAS
jgi:diacylglycerol kinase (ATP)